MDYALVMIAIANWCGSSPTDNPGRAVVQACRQTALTCWKTPVKGETDQGRLIRCLIDIKL